MGFLKGKSSLMIFDGHANLKYKYGSRHFGCSGYYVDICSWKERKDYIRIISDELEEDRYRTQ